ncbi:hypothetical protein BD769DRAFT_1668370 [Suillus cothurnatus]|nr:hypothetical protein BD769DRAFT_1668370 [Suillus cothurnatus]
MLKLRMVPTCVHPIGRPSAGQSHCLADDLHPLSLRFFWVMSIWGVLSAWLGTWAFSFSCQATQFVIATFLHGDCLASDIRSKHHDYTACCELSAFVLVDSRRPALLRASESVLRQNLLHDPLYPYERQVRLDIDRSFVICPVGHIYHGSASLPYVLDSAVSVSQPNTRVSISKEPLASAIEAIILTVATTAVSPASSAPSIFCSRIYSIIGSVFLAWIKNTIQAVIDGPLY